MNKEKRVVLICLGVILITGLIFFIRRQSSHSRQPSTETITEAITEIMTEANIKTMTEAVTETMTEASTEPATESITELTTEPETENTTEAYLGTAVSTKVLTPNLQETNKKKKTESRTEAQFEDVGDTLRDSDFHGAADVINKANQQGHKNELPMDTLDSTP